jgi:spore coat polysaccharide biosynthesis protein SpsF (cytidylyltransferase family)
MTETVAIIQARMGSTRLPGKVLEDIGDEPMLWHVYERAQCASLVDRVVVATSTEPGDDAVASFCEERDVRCFRGSEEDVLDRFYRAAVDIGADAVVRLTADCPLLSPPVIDRVIRTYQSSDAEYVTNILEYTHPDGLDVEVFEFEALAVAWEEASEPEEHEHVTPYIRESNQFSAENVQNVLNLSVYQFVDEDTILRWTVDYPEDLEFVRAVYDRLTASGHWVFDQQSVLELLERAPELRDINDDR